MDLSYKLKLKKYGVTRTEEELATEKARTVNIQDKFKEQLHLLIDMPTQNFGSTNDGNASRKEFKNYKLSAEILELDERIVKNLQILCQVVNSDCQINTTNQKFCDDFSNMYVELYNWYPIPPSIHKVLAHGPAIINTFSIPIGRLSEEAMESRHKHFKEFRRDHSRKFSRIATNLDIFHWLLLTSDPVINRNLTKSVIDRSDYLEEVLDILDLTEDGDNIEEGGDDGDSEEEMESEDDDDDVDSEDGEEEEGGN